ncbi:MAG: hypothetical protein A2233_01300 [Candidatus Kerfeldbacteria bacterium RIFOXYA2_FULL_38_24]|uniref:Uncharacterized protein n=1 Tax=Candidatus Kerfeldbacteria bacterium RIFOXYB2_FULL_38_14 TaxID=1798547 RepID=A0A1G2BDT1_9BACT|nr:MAG: hypothetical protein A2233_01300 [Candidatus Kerfeldbacteria bacterium RIFOXYA2_FULL_38_24]OGY87371.1 MAG: hypothetical protein A2319_05390 [Candidatus Kerfeldbacteria bacterium RIFOXYB2_FULL_38_14]OGY88853.1 MAG: hypothetical protein A2458_04335 [Candidatus Kerfeldbacteria bacterium RIFOXYC2_FULL_38_9]
MQIPLYIFLILYGVIFSVYLVWTFFNLYHIIKFGFFDFTGKVNTLLFVGFSLVILSVTYFLLKDIVWTDSLMLFSPISNFFDNSSSLKL